MNLVDYLAAAAVSAGDETAVDIRGERLTYRELYRCALERAIALRDGGLGRFGVVAVVSDDDVRLVEALFGTVAAAGIFSVLNPRWDAESTADALTRLQPSVVLVDARHHARAEEAVRRTSLPCSVERLDERPARSAPAAKCWPAAEALLRSPSLQPRSEDPAVVVFTSGSGGRPKAVLHSHRSLLLSAFQEIAALGVAFRSFVTTGGLYLSSGIGFLVASLVSQGVHAIEPAEDVERYLRAVEARRPVLARLTVSVAELDVRRFDLSSVELWLQGGHSLREDAFRSLLEQLGPRIVRGYGTTELMGVTALRPNDYLRSDAAAMSVGKPFPGVIVSVGDPSGLADLTHPGRILVRSPSQALGYLNDPTTTAGRFRDGWYDTGDVGQVDEEGFVHWLGRDTSDTFDREVWPQQVEVFVNLHRAIKDSAVAVRDGDVVAYVEPRAGSRVDPDEVVSYLRRHLTPNQLPGRVVVVERLPRDERGRVRVDELRRTLLPVAAEGVS